MFRLVLTIWLVVSAVGFGFGLCLCRAAALGDRQMQAAHRDRRRGLP